MKQPGPTESGQLNQHPEPTYFCDPFSGFDYVEIPAVSLRDGVVIVSILLTLVAVAYWLARWV